MRLTSLLSLAGTILANPAHLAHRQAPDLPAYTSAASALIASYIPPSAFSVLSASASSAAAAASVTGDISSLIYSALEDRTPPAWFGSAIPSEYSSAISGLTAAIASLAPTGTGAVVQTSAGSGPSQTIPTVVDTVVVVTSTNSAGSVVTKSVTSAVIVTGTEAAATSVGSSVTMSGGSGTGTRTSTAVTTSTSTSSTNAAATAAARPMCALAGLAVLAGLIAAV